MPKIRLGDRVRHIHLKGIADGLGRDDGAKSGIQWCYSQRKRHRNEPQGCEVVIRSAPQVAE